MIVRVANYFTCSRRIKTVSFFPFLFSIYYSSKKMIVFFSYTPGWSPCNMCVPLMCTCNLSVYIGTRRFRLLFLLHKVSLPSSFCAFKIETLLWIVHIWFPLGSYQNMSTLHMYFFTVDCSLSRPLSLHGCSIKHAYVLRLCIFYKWTRKWVWKSAWSHSLCEWKGRFIIKFSMWMCSTQMIA